MRFHEGDSFPYFRRTCNGISVLLISGDGTLKIRRPQGVGVQVSLRELIKSIVYEISSSSNSFSCAQIVPKLTEAYISEPGAKIVTTLTKPLIVASLLLLPFPIQQNVQAEFACRTDWVSPMFGRYHWR